ncbi:MFS general substrate transporter [Thozetella sp. PMI_491]|nr:MFS general substrate transporter [Thozetella sp. PMI_491]
MADAAPATREASERTPLLGHGDSQQGDGTGTPISEDNNVADSLGDQENAGSTGSVDPARPNLSRLAIFRILCILLIAVFVGNADGTIVMATNPTIASEFRALESASWLFTSFALASVSTQSILAKLSDIYGRKPILLICYALFAIGCVIVGLGQSMVGVILGRVVSGGVAGGMGVLVSIIVTDLVPIREIAGWRAYTNVVATTGRSIGGPVGGWLADVVGWRWSFIGQAPFILLAIFLCYIYLPADIGGAAKRGQDADSSKDRSKFARIDFLGAALFTSLMLSFLLPMEIGGVKIPWSHPLIGGLLAVATVLFVAFVQVERRWAKEPIIPMGLFAKRDVVASFVITSLQSAAQVGMMYCVPLYFQVTQRMSNTEAGAHLFPAVAANAVGGVISGALINRSGRYKWLVFFATFCACVSYGLLMLRWDGDTNWWESLYIMPGGFGTSIVGSSIFIAVQASVEKRHVAAAVSTIYLFASIGNIVGLASMSAVLQIVLRARLTTSLADLGLDDVQKAEIIAKAVSNVEYVLRAEGQVREAIVASYVDGLWYTHGISFLCSLAGFFLAFLLEERRI